MTTNDQLNDICERLEDAINSGDKRAILGCYEDVQPLDLDEADDDAFERYDDLVCKANDILDA